MEFNFSNQNWTLKADHNFTGKISFTNENPVEFNVIPNVDGAPISIDGKDGATGPTGPSGGPSGETGATGNDGVTGATGVFNTGSNILINTAGLLGTTGIYNFTNSWGPPFNDLTVSTQNPPLYFQQSQPDTTVNPVIPGSWFSTSFDQTTPGIGGTIPVLYSQTQVTGDNGILAHARMGYGVNNGGQDVIGVSGRVRRLPGANANSYACGVTGQKSSGDVGTVGLNMGSFSSINGYPEIGIKIGTATNHVYGMTDFKVATGNGTVSISRISDAAPTGKIDLNIKAGSNANAAINFSSVGQGTSPNIFFNGTSGIFFVNTTSVETRIGGSGSIVRCPTTELTNNSTQIATTAYVRGQQQVIQTSTANFVVTTYNTFLICNTGVSTVTLPTPNNISQAGSYIDIYNGTNGNITVTNPTGNFIGISTSSTFVISSSSSNFIRTDGVNWYVLR
jgi:hypothetical protein